MNIVYLNGEYIPQDKATVSIMDRGFLFGDGVYEVIPVYHGNIFRCEQHLTRLYQSLDGIQLSINLTKKEFIAIFQELLERNKHLGTNQSIYLQVTRGAAKERYHAFPKDVTPTILVFSYPLKTLPLAELAKGKSAITLDDTRWQFCNIKSTSLLANVLLYQQALDQSCAEAILIDHGLVVEGATSNIFTVKDNVIKTPPLSNRILGGVTRDLVLELARAADLVTEEVDLPEKVLFDADEVWITSSTREIYPITRINDASIGQGKPGPIWEIMIEKYHIYIQNI